MRIKVFNENFGWSANPSPLIFYFIQYIYIFQGGTNVRNVCPLKSKYYNLSLLEPGAGLDRGLVQKLEMKPGLS